MIESLNLLVSSTGNVLRSEILGAVKLKCYLSGMPELRLGLNDKAMFETTGRATRGKAVEMEDVKFHQCVRLSRFENDRTISFIPPDGEFELMSYRLNTQVKPLIWVESDVRSHSGSRIEYILKVHMPFPYIPFTFYMSTLSQIHKGRQVLEPKFFLAPSIFGPYFTLGFTKREYRVLITN